MEPRANLLARVLWAELAAISQEFNLSLHGSKTVDTDAIYPKPTTAGLCVPVRLLGVSLDVPQGRIKAVE